MLYACVVYFSISARIIQEKIEFKIHFHKYFKMYITHCTGRMFGTVPSIQFLFVALLGIFMTE